MEAEHRRVHHARQPQVVRWLPVILITLAASCDGGEPSTGMAVALQRDVRRFALRLGDAQIAHPCVTDPADSRALCVLPNEAIARFRELAQSYFAGNDGAVEGRVLLDVVAAPHDPRVLARSLTALDSADSAGSRQLAPPLRTLVYALRAEATDDPLDRLRALDNALTSARHASSSPAALFNAALLLGESGLIRESRAAWDAFLAIEEDAAWRREAELRRAALVIEPPPAPPTDSATAYAFAVANPQRARELALDSILPAWGRAVLADSAATAGRLVSVLRALGSGLLDSTRERAVADVVAWLDAAGTDTHLIRDAARAHALFGEARALFMTSKNRQAAPVFREAATLFERAGSPFLSWAELYLAVLMVYEGSGDAARAALEERESAPPGTTDALTAMTLRAMGLAESRAARYGPALARHRESQEFFAAGREERNVAASRNLAAEIRLQLGDAHRAWDELLTVLEGIGRRPADVSLQNALHVAGTEASRLQLHAAAASFHAEGVRVAGETGRVHDLPEALLRYARTLLAGGLPDSAVAAIERADDALKYVSDVKLRGRLLAEAAETRALVLVDIDPQAALNHAVAAAAFYEANELAARIIVPYVIQARALLALGNVEGAADGFSRALAVFDLSLGELTDPIARAMLVQRAVPAGGGLASLQLRAGEAARALATYSRLFARAYPEQPARTRSRGVVADEVTLVYAVLQDSIAVWTITEGDTTARWIPDRPRVTELIDRVEAAILADDTSALGGLRELHELVVAPATLPASVERITFVPDGVLSRIPFAALIDSAGDHLVEHLIVRTTGTADGARAPWNPGDASSAHALLVGVPTPAGTALPTLHAVGAEIGELARLYVESVLLEGNAATPSAFLAGVSGSDVVHFAGHALPSGAQPFTARLVLTPEADGSGEVLASEIAGMDLRHINLVVLAACATAEAGSDRGGAFASLAGAFTGAGVGAVVGSLWPVDDEATADLLVDFHMRLRGGLGPAEALAAAQRARMNSGELRSWAAFGVIQ